MPQIGEDDAPFVLRCKMRSNSMSLSTLAGALADYARRHPHETDAHSADAVAAPYLALLAEGPRAFLRDRLDGHFTGSAWLVSADGARVLLTHHRKLNRWLQLGGHADGDHDLARVALREAEEESGLFGLRVEPEIFDLDRHWIPERGDVPGHWHYDVRYVVRATASEDFAVSEESLALAWRDIDALISAPALDPSIVRMATKWTTRRGEPMLDP